jgi:hypothetical protein
MYRASSVPPRTKGAGDSGDSGIGHKLGEPPINGDTLVCPRVLMGVIKLKVGEPNSGRSAAFKPQQLTSLMGPCDRTYY